MEIKLGLNLAKGCPLLKSGSRKAMGCGLSSGLGAPGTRVYGRRSRLACPQVCVQPKSHPTPAVCTAGD